MGNSVVSLKPTRRISTPVVILIVLLLCVSPFLSGLWWLFVLVGALLMGASFFPQEQVLASVGQSISDRKENPVPENQFIVPQSWDPQEIGIQVRRIQSDASLLRIYVDSVVERFVIGQDARTAGVRIEFLKSKLKELSLSKELQASLDELEFRKVKLEIERLELEDKKATLEGETKRRREISELEHERDALKLKLEVAELIKKMDEVRKPPKPEPSPPPAQTREQKREEIERKLRDYKRQEAEVRVNPDLDEDTRRRMLNILSSKTDALYEELEKYI